MPINNVEGKSSVDKESDGYRMHLMLCAGTGCVSSGSYKIKDALERELAKHNLTDEVTVVMTGCNGFCAQGPVMVVKPDEIFYQRLKEKDIPHLVEEHMLKGRPVKELMYTPPAEESVVPKMSDIGFFKKQRLLALRNRGLIDPEVIEEYIARGGYKALAKALAEMKPEEVVREMIASGLRGRGGGGFPTGIKWKTCRETPGEPKYVVCNADEGDPGAYMDRSIIEGDPHSVLEGMIIAAYAIGSSNGYIYIRHEYPLALKRLERAIADAREYGLLGKNIFDRGFDFDVTIHCGAGAFVCGESTALMASMEGRVGEPRAKYIHTVEHGLWDRPTSLNNVETYANVPLIILRGAKWFTSIGTGDVADNPWGGSKGTKVFSLVGKVQNTGLVEVAMGITLREIIFDIGGGIPNGKKFKAVQTGGPSGGVIPENLLDLPVDFDQLTRVGSMMGSGGMIVMDEDDCMVDIARYFIEFLVGESCGKCLPCREGLMQINKMLNDICSGQAQEGVLELLEQTCNMVASCSLCALGGSAPNPVLSTLRYFRDEYEAHVRDKKCPAGLCKDLITYYIDPEKCTGCMLCARNCPQNAIEGEKKKIHKINTDLCIKCGICRDVCNKDAVMVK
ncbi:MAG: NADH-quinone oxidoreductase subunit NuoF [candidate division Zixibacteria bacterium]|nr:NADH-quinone oxidoreductase subunit NuoF [candidate division Zixibacteria bacterium]